MFRDYGFHGSGFYGLRVQAFGLLSFKVPFGSSEVVMDSGCFTHFRADAVGFTTTLFS